MMRIICILFIFISSIYAHKLNVFTNFEDNKLYVNSYFANGNACQKCKIRIIKDDKLVIEDKTNTKGEFETTVNYNSFILSVDAGSGHAILKDIQKVIKPKKRYENNQLQKLQEENKNLKLQIKLLEERLSYFEFFKIVFALIVIIGIFTFLKRVKKS
ncbi:hypothetical protein [Arcobacter roscoffensis]|uniref:GOLD domain-containing protein n=1 Tax=Arcobacter roscoffensis TaxID=2961520 RepID=A0ABY5E1F7_9BACT|nr:hypothetical protein [Arcobacter roscoffensis]UTJ06034.1 hypothetical protein NJU99_12345 [Arcobacter roscoffensis]